MKNTIKKIFSSEFGRGVFALIALMFFGNILSYLFQFSMAWLLGPADYSILAVITSIVAIFGIPTQSIQTIVAKHTTELKVEKKLGSIKGMLKNLTKKVLAVSFIGFIIFSIISYFWIEKFLKIDSSLLIFAGLFIFGAFLYPINAGILQGSKKFKELGFSFVVNGLLKLSIGIFLVLLGWKVYGAVFGFIIGILFSFFIIFIFIKDILKSKESPEKISILSNKNFFPFLAIMIFVLMFNVDVIFAKAFFSAEVAGKYSVLSLLGKMILFIAISVGNVMFPINSERFLNGGKTGGVLKKSLLFISLICGISLIVFLFFPEMIINILFGSQYLLEGKILFYIGVAFSSLSFMNIFILNSISKNRFKSKKGFALILALIFEIALFCLFHKSIKQFSFVFMISMLIPLAIVVSIKTIKYCKNLFK